MGGGLNHRRIRIGRALHILYIFKQDVPFLQENGVTGIGIRGELGRNGKIPIIFNINLYISFFKVAVIKKLTSKTKGYQLLQAILLPPPHVRQHCPKFQYRRPPLLDSTYRTSTRRQPYLVYSSANALLSNARTCCRTRGAIG